MFCMTDKNVLEVYAQLKDRYDLILTTTSALDEDFTIDCPILIGNAHEQIIELYSDGDMFVMDVMDKADGIYNQAVIEQKDAKVRAQKMISDMNERIVKSKKGII